MHQNGDYTHFYFCYRWFLLDFKRGTDSILSPDSLSWSFLGEEEGNGEADRTPEGRASICPSQHKPYQKVTVQ